jgi:hypothetical protein
LANASATSQPVQNSLENKFFLPPTGKKYFNGKTSFRNSFQLQILQNIMHLKAGNVATGLFDA